MNRWLPILPRDVRLLSWVSKMKDYLSLGMNWLYPNALESPVPVGKVGCFQLIRYAASAQETEIVIWTLLGSAHYWSDAERKMAPQGARRWEPLSALDWGKPGGQYQLTTRVILMLWNHTGFEDAPLMHLRQRLNNDMLQSKFLQVVVFVSKGSKRGP